MEPLPLPHSQTTSILIPKEGMLVRSLGPLSEGHPEATTDLFTLKASTAAFHVGSMVGRMK